MATNMNEPACSQEPAQAPPTINPPTPQDLPYTLDNVLEIHTRLCAHETTLITTSASYRQTATTYTTIIETTFDSALSLSTLSRTDEAALRAAGDSLQQAAQRMHVHLSSAELRGRNARRLMDEAMLTPAGGREVALVVFEAFRKAQVELVASVEHLIIAGRCAERAAEEVGPVVERVGGVLGEMEREINGEI